MAIAWIEMIVALLLIAVILMQVRGSGTTLFGQADSSFRVRRGIEKILFRSTIGLAALFVIIAVLSVSKPWE